MEFLDFGDMPKMTPIIGKFPKLGTNKAEILMFLLSGDQPTNKQMGNKLDCVSSAARICELRQDGWLIDAHQIPYRTEMGKDVYYCKYYIKNLQDVLTHPRVQQFIDWHRKYKQ